MSSKTPSPNKPDSEYHWLSACHDAEIIVRGGAEGTNASECTVCHEACGIYDKNMKDAMRPSVEAFASEVQAIKTLQPLTSSLREALREQLRQAIENTPTETALQVAEAYAETIARDYAAEELGRLLPGADSAVGTFAGPSLEELARTRIKELRDGEAA